MVSDACDPGYFSASGIEPCSPCDIGFYTSKYGSRECTSCPGEKISRLGATYERDCFGNIISTNKLLCFTWAVFYKIILLNAQ